MTWADTAFWDEDREKEDVTELELPEWGGQLYIPPSDVVQKGQLEPAMSTTEARQLANQVLLANMIYSVYSFGVVLADYSSDNSAYIEQLWVVLYYY